MNRRHLTLAILLLALGLALAGCGGDDDEGRRDRRDDGGEHRERRAGGGTSLNGSVGPGFDDQPRRDGRAHARATTRSSSTTSRRQHNFHLTGPGGVDVATEVSAEGEESFDVTLEAGEYTFVCDPHAAQMKGSFTVG